MWLATRNGLKPLQEISANLKSRNSADLSPTGIKTDFIEVKPLISAIDGLLESMRQKVGRETAFVQEAAHELRTPMAVISAQAHVLKRANDEATRLEAASSLDQAIKRANHLVEQLLVLARLDANEESQWSEVNLAALIGDTLAMLAPKAITKNIELSLEVPDELTHKTNEHAIVSIIQNLVSNAIQYIPNNAQINVIARRVPSGIEITVQDSGNGIEKSDLPYIFERFYRGKMHDTPGSGLGLSIVETAVKKLNGSIEVSSSNTGACFTVSLP
ncbi:sensor histidine kinase [Rhodoferax mekongensis]|uniref:histidine kinase n=1 Tax=Rhodoferax mekongensis TaxID=3068341 RepID=A0ABZ0AWA7_9BURK|nr:HAMP domain-containing sensor histidine kinase [Rhodoferax sp. TBRC 17307]WNO03930.1 HAMP domain-containing sensor histidine kinase [Rhodoferax sp. TBRC 17307]